MPESESERFWEPLLQRLDEGSVVPIVGQDLLTIQGEDGKTRLFPLVAKRLAEALTVPSDDLPRGAELPEVARRYLTGATSRDSLEIYRNVRKIFLELDPIPVPRPLVQLAEITKLKLYVTTTFDSLIERAIDQVRFGGQRQTLAFVYAPNDKQDLPPEFDRLSRPAVFYLMGRLSATPRSYAVTREDVLEFTGSLQSRAEDSPGFLFDKLRGSDLLLIGSHFADWLARVFARNPAAGRLVDAVNDGGDAPISFVEHASGAVRSLPHRDASEFVQELRERWRELDSSDDSLPPESLDELTGGFGSGVEPGAVVLSCALSDRKEAETIRDALDRAGVDVIVDSDDVPLAEKWERKLRHTLSECSLFVPLFSARSAVAPRRLSRTDWIDNVVKVRGSVPSKGFILPVVIDDATPDASALPAAFSDLRWERMRGGTPSADFVKTVVRLQRSYRRTSFA